MSHSTILEALERAGCRSRTGGQQWTCPAHSDSTPSLSLSRGSDGRVLLHCFAGCAPQAVVEALGIKMGDLFDETQEERVDGHVPPRVVAHHDYVDAGGELLFQIVRTYPKGFWGRQPDGRGGWINNLRGVRRVLYRVRELLAAVAAGDPIYICEGEKDVDALHDAGAVATCNVGGAGKWKNEYAELLRNADVTIVADKDAPGIAHARTIAESLKGVAKSVRIVEAKTGKDSADHLAAGHSIEDFVELGEEETLRPHSAPRAAKILWISDVESRQVEFLSDPFLPLGKLVMVDGFEGCGKTFLMLSFCSAVSRGWPLPDKNGVNGGLSHEPAAALYLSAEDGVADTLRPRLEQMGADISKVAVLNGFTDENGGAGYFKLSDFDVLESALDQVKPLLVVVDPVMAFLDANGNRSDEVRPVLSRLSALAEAKRCVIVLVRHFRKAAAERSSHRGVGSVDFSAACRSVLVLAEDPDDPTRRVVAHAKSNLAPRAPSISFEIRDGALRWIGQTELSADELLESREQREQGARSGPRGEAVDFLCEVLQAGQVAAEKVKAEARAAGISQRTLDRAKRELGIRARPVPDDDGGRHWFWSLPEKHRA